MSHSPTLSNSLLPKTLWSENLQPPACCSGLGSAATICLLIRAIPIVYFVPSHTPCPHSPTASPTFVPCLPTPRLVFVPLPFPYLAPLPHPHHPLSHNFSRSLPFLWRSSSLALALLFWARSVGMGKICGCGGLDPPPTTRSPGWFCAPQPA